MARKEFFFFGGRVSSKEPVFLGEGELSLAEDAEYLPGDPGIWSVAGTAAYNTVPEAGSIRAGGTVEFDDGSGLVVVAVGNNLRRGPLNLTGEFSDFTGVGSPPEAPNAANGILDTFIGSNILDITHYRDDFIILNGIDRPRIIDGTGVMSYLGMRPNVDPPIISDTGVLSGFTLANGNTIDYWIEERVKDANGEIIRRNASGLAQVAKLTGTGSNVKPVAARPAIVDRQTTHWALYGSATNSVYPTGFEIAEATIATPTIEDTRSTNNPPAPSGPAFPLVTVTVDGLISAFPKYGPPPLRASTGDIWEDAAVINDKDDPSIIRFSFLDDIHSWPGCNLINFQTKQHDEVKVIRSLESVCVVLMRDQMWRINTLPQPGDSAFETQRVKEKGAVAPGVVGSAAATLIPGRGGVRLAYVSHYGVIVTDGYQWDVLTDDAKWEGIAVNESTTLRYNAGKFRLEMGYQEDGVRKVMFLHLHPSHTKVTQLGQPRAKCTWPINRPVTCLFDAVIGSKYYMFGGGSDGKVYLTDTGSVNVMPTGVINCHIRTALSYVQGIGEELNVTKTYLHHSAAGNSSAKLTLIQHSEGSNDEQVFKDIVLNRAEASTMNKSAFGEAVAIDVVIANPSSPVRLNGAMIDYTSDGLEQAGN